MNLNELLAPFDLLASDNFHTDSAVNDVASITLVNGLIFCVTCGYDVGGVAAGAVLTITDDGTVRFQVPITADGPQQFIFRPAMKPVDGGDLVAAISAGGAGVTGYLNITGVVQGVLLPTLAQEAVNQDGPNIDTFSVVLGTNPVAGNSIIVSVAGAQPKEVVFDDANNTPLTKVAGEPGTNISIWCADNIDGGADNKTININYASTGNTGAANVSEWYGKQDASALDISTRDGESTSPTTNPVAPSAARTLIIAAISAEGAADPYLSGPSNNFVRLTQAGSDALGLWLESSYLVSEAAGSFSTSINLNVESVWAADAAAFLAS